MWLTLCFLCCCVFITIHHHLHFSSIQYLLLHSTSFMSKQLKQKCVLCSSEEENVPFCQALSQVWPSGLSFYVDSVLRKVFFKPLASSSINQHLFQSSSAPFKFTSYKQASCEANKGLKGKEKSTRSTSGWTVSNDDHESNQKQYSILISIR